MSLESESGRGGMPRSVGDRPNAKDTTKRRCSPVQDRFDGRPVCRNDDYDEVVGRFLRREGVRIEL